MVRGLETFRAYFKDFADNYVIIGGTACNELVENKDLRPRATKDIDAILIVEALSDNFVRRFWEFIKEGKYELWQTASGETQFYRFIKPKTDNFPLQIELFSRVPDMIKVPEGAHLTPIPVGEELSSFSAILLNDDYYHYAVSHTRSEFTYTFIKRIFANLHNFTNFADAQPLSVKADCLRTQEVSFCTFIERRNISQIFWRKHFWRRFRNHIKTPLPGILNYDFFSSSTNIDTCFMDYIRKGTNENCTKLFFKHYLINHPLHKILKVNKNYY